MAGRLRAPVILPCIGAIDTTTPIEIHCASDDALVFFTIDGSKPEPFEVVGGTHHTLTYTTPFVLEPGRRIVRAIALSSTNSSAAPSSMVTRSYDVAGETVERGSVGLPRTALLADTLDLSRRSRPARQLSSPARSATSLGRTHHRETTAVLCQVCTATLHDLDAECVCPFCGTQQHGHGLHQAAPTPLKRTIHAAWSAKDSHSATIASAVGPAAPAADTEGDSEGEATLAEKPHPHTPRHRVGPAS